jgi:hypothetical protein
MYKKITHTITEEHFDHPIAAEIKKHIDKTKSANLPTAAQFKQDVLSWFTNFNVKGQKVIDGVSDKNLDITTAEADLFDQIDALGNELKNYYGIEIGERFNTLMRTAAVSVIRLVFLMRNDMDIKDLQTNRFSGMISGELTTLLNSINNSWMPGTTRAAIDSLWNSWIEIAKAKKTGNEATLTTAKSNANAAFSAFADVLANGVIKQHMPTSTTM